VKSQLNLTAYSANSKKRSI